MTGGLLQYSKDDRIAILKKFDVTAKDVDAMIMRIKEWVVAQPFFPEIPGDGIIEKCLLISKFRVEKAKQRLTTYYVIRSVLPEFFNRNPNSPEMLAASNVFYYIPLPKLNADLHRATLICLKDADPSKFDPILYFAYTISIGEVRLREDYRYKEIQIYDLKDMKLGHLIKFTPTIIKKVAYILEKLYDHNIFSIHFLNGPSYVESFITLVRGLLKTKLEERVMVHKDLDSLYKVISKDNLPEEYGGTAGSLAEMNENWRKKFVEYDGYLEERYKLQVNKSLLPENLKINDDFGVHGNFRKLDFD